MDQVSSCLVSIITVCHNQLEGLKRTYQSVKDQWANDIEWLVIDGASNDGSQAWLAGCDYDKLRYLSEPFEQRYAAMNKGVSLARGTWVLFLNAGDCFCGKQVLRKVITLLQTELDIVAGHTIYFSRYGTRVCHARPLGQDGAGMPFFLTSTLIKRELLQRRPFDTRYGLAADYELLHWAASQQKVDLVVCFPIGLYDGRSDRSEREIVGRQQEIRQILGRYEGFRNQLCWKGYLAKRALWSMGRWLLPHAVIRKRRELYYTTNC